MFREQGSALAQGSESTQGSVEVTLAPIVALGEALAKTQLNPIFNLPSMHQPQKFDSVKDLITVEEWLESVKSAMNLFDMTDQERVRYALYFFKSNHIMEPSPRDYQDFRDVLE